MAPGAIDTEVVPNVGPDPEPAESTSNCKLFEVPPPGAGVSTETVVTPEDTICVAGTWAVIWLALTNWVVRAVDPQYTVEPDMNPEPLIVSVKAAEPALVKTGERVVRPGSGFEGGTLIVNTAAIELPPPGAELNTATCAVPGAARSDAGTFAVTCWPLTNVVVRGI